jgi:hypothetical protein
VRAKARGAVEPATPPPATAGGSTGVWGRAKRVLGFGGGATKKAPAAPAASSPPAPAALPASLPPGVVPSDTATQLALRRGAAAAEGEAAEDRERRGGLAAEAALRTAEAGWGDEVDAVGGLADVREAAEGGGALARYAK